MRANRSSAALTTLALVAIAIPRVAAASATCSFEAPRVLVSIAGPATLSVGPGQVIMVDAVPCGSATTSNTDEIVVEGTASSSDAADLDLSGGPFAPGATPEPTGTSEIEIDVDLRGDAGDRVSVLGTLGDDRLVATAAGIDLTADDDVDVLVSDPVTLDGRAGDDSLLGDGGRIGPPAGFPMELRGGPGDDTLAGGNGDDRLDGGLGRDVATFVGAPGSIRADLGEGRAHGHGVDSLTGIEDLVGSPHRDFLLGDGGPNRLEGGGGRDRLTGGPGDDAMIGGPARDFLKPGPGNDVVLGGRGIDTLSLRSAPRRVLIDLERGRADGDGHDRLGAIEKAVGSRFADLIRGSSEDNHRLVGGRGNDRLLGRGGDDRLRGGPGDDRLFGGAGDDELSGGTGNDELDGGSGRDHLTGGPGDDVCVRRPEDRIVRCST